MPGFLTKADKYGVVRTVLILVVAQACAEAETPSRKPAGLGDEVTASESEKIEAAPAEAVQGIVISYEQFGEIRVNGKVYTRDIVIEDGVVREREKGPSRSQRDKYGHTPLTPEEEIPWDCTTLVIGTGMHGRLPIVDEFYEAALKTGVELVVLKTGEAAAYYMKHHGSGVNAVFHITC